MFVNSQKSTKMSLNNRWHFWIIVVFPSLDLPSEPPGWVGKDFPQVRMQEVTTNVVSQQLTVNAQLGSPCLDEGWCFVGDGGPLQKRIRHKKKANSKQTPLCWVSRFFMFMFGAKKCWSKPGQFRTKGATGQHITIGPGNVSTKHQQNIGRCVMMVFVWQRKNQQQTEIVLVTI